MSDLVEALRRKLDRHPRPIPVHVRVALERTCAGLTVSHCARAMGWPPTYWQRIESGTRTISEDELPRVAAILGVTDVRLRGLQATTVPGRKRPGRRPAQVTVATSEPRLAA
jgi:transcriptional regulator with XRE-family HTH domain